MGRWERRRGYPGCPFLNALVDIRQPPHPALREVRSYIAEVEGFFADNARAADTPNSDTVGFRLRLIAMGMFMTFALERAAGPEVRAKADADLPARVRHGNHGREFREPVDSSNREQEGLAHGASDRLIAEQTSRRRSDDDARPGLRPGSAPGGRHEPRGAEDRQRRRRRAITTTMTDREETVATVRRWGADATCAVSVGFVGMPAPTRAPSRSSLAGQ